MTSTEIALRLLPIAIISAIAPLKISAMILLFRTPRRGVTGAAYAAGVIGALVAQGILLVSVFSIFGIFSALQQDATESVSSGLLVALGVLLLAGALKLRFQEHDDDRPPPKWMEGIESFTPRRALILGFGWAFVSPKQWLFSLAAVSIIFFAGLDQINAVANYLVYVAIATSTLWILVLVHALFGERVKPTMDRLLSWLEQNTRSLIIWLLMIFGALLLVVGLTGLSA